MEYRPRSPQGKALHGDVYRVSEERLWWLQGKCRIGEGYAFFELGCEDWHVHERLRIAPGVNVTYFSLQAKRTIVEFQTGSWFMKPGNQAIAQAVVTMAGLLHGVRPYSVAPTPPPLSWYTRHL